MIAGAVQAMASRPPRKAPFRLIYSNDCTNICTGEVLTAEMIQAATRLSPDFRERCALRIAPSSTHLPTAQPAGKQGEQQEEP